MITDGPVDGSTPECIDCPGARGSSTSQDRLRYRPAQHLSNTRRRPPPDYVVGTSYARRYGFDRHEAIVS